MNELLQADLFKHFPGWNAIVYQGSVTPKLLKFEVTEGETTRPLYLAAIISREEKLSWQSFQDLLDHAAALASAGMQGLYGLEVLSVDIGPGIRHFNPQDLSRLLINHSKNLGASHRVLIRYGQMFCVLHKRAPADWGKIEVKTRVEIVDPEKTKLANFLKKLRRESGGETGSIYLVHDLSSAPVWDPAETLPPDTFVVPSKPI